MKTILNSEDQRFSFVLKDFTYLAFMINAHQFLQRKTSPNSSDAPAHAPYDVVNANHHAACRCIDHYSDLFDLEPPRLEITRFSITRIMAIRHYSTRDEAWRWPFWSECSVNSFSNLCR